MGGERVSDRRVEGWVNGQREDVWKDRDHNPSCALCSLYDKLRLV